MMPYIKRDRKLDRLSNCYFPIMRDDPIQARRWLMAAVALAVPAVSPAVYGDTRWWSLECTINCYPPEGRRLDWLCDLEEPFLMYEYRMGRDGPCSPREAELWQRLRGFRDAVLARCLEGK